jgi:hypothetical protein
LSDDPRAGLPPTEETYNARLSARREREARLTRVHHLLGYSKLATLVVATGFLVGALREGTGWPWGGLWPPALLFLLLSVVQEMVVDRRETARRAARFYQDGLRRLRGEIDPSSPSGSSFRRRGHPYADDLDVFGDGSLFQLVNRCATVHGQEALAHRLMSASPQSLTADAVRRRQESVRELVPLLDLREDLAVAGDTVEERDWERERLDAWAAAPAALDRPGLWRAAGVIFPAITLTLIVGSFLGWPSWPAWLSAIPLLSVYFSTSKKSGAILAAVEAPARVLSSYERLAARVEAQSFTSADLRDLHGALEHHDTAASREIRRLRRILSWVDALRNHLFAGVAGPLLLWGVHCSLALEAWRRRCGDALPRWLEALGEAEAGASLAALADERRRYTFPEILDDGPPSLEAEDVGHPLLGTSCVPNSLTLEGPGSVLLVSGCNSSGKSTLLRSVGINVALAMAGSVVHATRLALPPLAPATSMRLVDSLQEGTSHFVAEVKRLRKVMDVAESGVPTLFLLDEILQGTNARERLLGARSLVAELIRRGAIGLVTTHDLALADLEDAHAGMVRNVHFADRVEKGRMHFDYRMRPGVIDSTNALRLMKANGLPVDLPEA